MFGIFRGKLLIFCLLGTALSAGTNEEKAIHTFIRTKLKSYIKRGQYYLPPARTGLTKPIEYDPKTGSTFIHLERIGSGARKKVVRVVRYDEKRPEFLACLSQKKPFGNELEMMSKLNRVPGIIQYKAYTTHQENGQKVHSLYCKLYRQSTIFVTLNGKKYSFSPNEKIGMAYRIVSGLAAMQKKKMVHLDLHAHNCLVDISQGAQDARTIDVVIADFGRAEYSNKVKLNGRQGNLNYTPPEVFLRPLNKKDYFGSDTFACGCLLYWLFYEKQPSWQCTDYSKQGVSQKERGRRLYRLIDEATRARRMELADGERKGMLDRAQRFEQVILQMVHPDAKKRISAEAARGKLKKLVHF